MNKSSFQKFFLIALTAALMGAVGCSSIQAPTASVSQAQLAVREAERVKAAQYAPLEIRQAREKLSDAETAMRNQEYLKARRLSEQALVDAQLAGVKADSEIARETAAELQKAINSLRAEVERGSLR